MFVFISGPYTKGDVAENVRAACRAAESVADAGHVPFVPHLFHLWHLISPHDYAYWMSLDEQMLRKCDCMLRIPGESAGADQEEQFAGSIGIPVFHGADWSSRT